MLELLGIPESIKFITYLMLSFSFYCGILLLVSQEAFEHFSAALQREFGLKKKLVPRLEANRTNFIDRMALKYRIVFGLLISTSAFILLLVYKF